MKKPKTPDTRRGPGAAPSPRREAGQGAVAELSAAGEVADFVARMKALGPQKGGGRGRLIFAMDATMSREPTWDMALALQADMFHTVKEVGGLDVQLVYFRGSDECGASKWVSDAEALARLMTRVACHGGYTQIGKVLTHARREAEKGRVSALVFVGDAMEESDDDLFGRAGELALHGIPVFLFQEGDDQAAGRAFREIARLTKGAACRFDAGSAAQLRELLTAVAVYAAGGREALKTLVESGTSQGARLLLAQMKTGLG
jgi:hypothetical protein